MSDQLEPIHKVELALLRAEHQKKFQVQIDYIKEKIGPGVEYRNAVARVVVSPRGAYYELLDLPEEFSGGISDAVEVRFISTEEAVDLFTRAVGECGQATPENTRQICVMALYTRTGVADRKNCFLHDYQPQAANASAVVLGKFRPGVLPLFFKLKFDTDGASGLLGMSRGVVFCLASAGERNLLVRIPYDADPNLIDLAQQANNITVQ